MELQKILNLLNKNRKLIFRTSLGFGLLGLVLYFAIPKTYKATGSFYVSREIDAIRRSEFTYEGFYAQQAAANSTEAAVGIFESVDVQSESLKELQIPVTKSNLTMLNRKVRVKKISPQLFTLTVKGNSTEQAASLWDSLASKSVVAFEDLSLRGDPNMNITLVGSSSVVYESSGGLIFNTVAGFLLGLLFSTTAIVLKEYLK